MAELLPKQPHIACTEAEAFSNYVGRQAVDEGGPECLIAALPLRDGAGEVGGISHANYYII